MKITKRQLRRIIREAVLFKEYSRHDPDSGYDELRQQKDDGDWDVLDDEEEAAREKERALMRRAAAERNRQR